jgi:hypothetical protein
MDDVISIANIGYDTILSAYNSFFSNKVISNTLLGFKVLAILLFVLSIYSGMVDKVASKWNMESGTLSLPYSPSKLLISLIFVLLIASYDQLLILLDNVFLNLDNVFKSSIDLGINFQEETIEEEVSNGWKQALVSMGNFFSNLVSSGGSSIFMNLLHGLAKGIDAMIFGVFIIERFFMLGLLKIIGPFAISISIFKAGNEQFMKWLKLYIATYVLIIPFFLVLGFTNEIASTIKHNVAQLFPLELLLGNSIEVILIIFLIWVKIKLFKKSYDMVYKVLA